MKKYLFILGSRAEWGYISGLSAILREHGSTVDICATNSSILAEYGDLATSVQDSHNVRFRILSHYSGDRNEGMAKSISSLISSLVDILSNHEYDWVILAGDRAEQLAAAIAASYLYVPSAHIQAGERSGSIDDRARHAIARLTNLHLTSNRDATERLTRSGEEIWRINEVGAPQLDELVPLKQLDSTQVLNKHQVKPREYLLVCMHATTDDRREAISFSNSLFDILDRLGIPVIWILPNNDAGSSELRDEILQKIPSCVKPIVNMPRFEYLHILKNATALIGNTSSGILESASFGISTLNLGSRQRNRFRPENVIDVAEADLLPEAISKVLTEEFQNFSSHVSNPYGDGQSIARILKLLEKEWDKRKLLVKDMTY